jgi:hypothetical protein
VVFRLPKVDPAGIQIRLNIVYFEQLLTAAAHE